MVLNYDKSKEECFDMLMQTNTYLRKMETCGKTVVAINGLTLGEDAK
jgi:3-hydroxyacyl-CoA dehydrogenase/enoyl-CoA hydratase/3-hydroxybutyryl-CoA epimerase